MHRYKIVFTDNSEEEIICKEFTVDTFCNIRFLSNDGDVILFANAMSTVKYVMDVDVSSKSAISTFGTPD